MQTKPFYGWKLLCIFWVIIVFNFTFPTFGTSVVNTYMAKAMHLNGKQHGLAFTVFSLMAGLPGPLVAISIRKYGIRPTLVIGTLITSFGAFLMATRVNTLTQAVLVFGIDRRRGRGHGGHHRAASRDRALVLQETWTRDVADADFVRHRRIHRGADAEWRDRASRWRLASGVVADVGHVAGCGIDCRVFRA